MEEKLPDDLIGVSEAACVVRVSRQSIHNWIKKGRLQAYRIGGYKLFVSSSELRALRLPVRVEREGKAG